MCLSTIYLLNRGSKGPLIFTNDNIGKILFQMTMCPFEKKEKNLKLGEILAFQEKVCKMVAEASCHTCQQLKSVIDINLDFLSSMLSCSPS